MQIGFILVLFLLFLPKDLHAATITSTASTASLNYSDELEVDVNLNINAKDGNEYYLRGVFFLPDDNNYCGYTWNGSEWFSGPYSSNEQWKNFQKINVYNNSWTGKLKAKIDPQDPGCKNTGTYVFKIQRFTTSGGSTFDDQKEISLNVTLPTPTPTPQPAPTSTPSPTPTKKPTATPRESNEIVLRTTLTDDESAKLTKEILGNKDIYDSNEKNISSSPTKTKKRLSPVKNMEIEKKSEEKISSSPTSNNGQLFVYLGGGSMLCACGILLYRNYKKRND